MPRSLHYMTLVSLFILGCSSGSRGDIPSDTEMPGLGNDDAMAETRTIGQILVRSDSADEKLIEARGIPISSAKFGCKILDLPPDGLFEKSGFLNGDVIQKVDGEPVGCGSAETFEKLRRLIENGFRTAIIRRRGRTLEFRPKRP